MSEHVLDELPLHAAGHLTGEEAVRVEAHLATCADCRKAAAEADTVAEGLTGAPASVLAALDQKLEGAGRFEHLLDRVAELYDLSLDDARKVVSAVDKASSWATELAQGVWLCPVTAGPKVQGAFTVLVKVEPGAVFPTHTHGGRERVLILEGGYRDISGVEFWRGELDERDVGTSHSFTGLEGLGCLCAAVMRPLEGK
jgi:putative transcriptional regulator